MADKPDKPEKGDEPLFPFSPAARTEQFAVTFRECGLALVIACSVDSVSDLPEGMSNNTRGIVHVVVAPQAIATRADEFPDIPAKLKSVASRTVPERRSSRYKEGFAWREGDSAVVQGDKHFGNPRSESDWYVKVLDGKCNVIDY